MPPSDKKATFIIYLVDDDPVMLRWMEEILSHAGFHCQSFSSTADFLAERDGAVPGCAVVDYFLSDGTGETIQAELNRRTDPLPLIMISGGSDIPIAVKSMQLGARAFLVKPFGPEELLANVRRALEAGEQERNAAAHGNALRGKLAELTERERDVLRRMLQGEPNKAIAADMNLSERTIEHHRSQLMSKLGVRSVAELVKLVYEAGGLDAGT